MELTFNFSIEIISLYKLMVSNKEYVIARQLLKSATSIGANVEESLAAQSRKDFISKMSIASKEARETRYWLRLLDKSKLVEIDLKPYLLSVEKIINILTRIVKTTQESFKNNV